MQWPIVCRGLWNYCQYGWSYIFVEPRTRKFKRLPDTWIKKYKWQATGFTYQSETNDYEVVKIYLSSSSRCYNEEPQLVAEVYTLSLGSWRRVEVSLRPKVEVSCFTANSTATFVSGALHWLGEFLEFNEDNDDDETNIFSFNVKARICVKTQELVQTSK